MDIQIPLIFVGLFVIACVTLSFVYKFGIKEKSYEEALAEQRQQTQALLGLKPIKPKEKKNKKAKKLKDTKEKQESETADELDSSPTSEAANAEPPKKHQEKPHVEFKEVEENIKEVAVKKKIKKDKVKPILLNKDNENVIAKSSESPITNHFEKLHPKDEFELLKSTNGDELVVKHETIIKPIKTKSSTTNELETIKKQPIESPKKVVKRAQAMTAPTTTTTTIIEEKAPIVQKKNEENEDKSTPPQNNSPINGVLLTNTGKEKKKKKSEFNTLQQLAGDKSGANISLLLDLVRKAELSRSEVQILIDLLLNKQHEAPIIVDDWSEGKSDPIQKLKRQLAEKEKLLIEEQEALQGAQAKLREVRSEQLQERSQFQQKIRNFEELIQNKLIEYGRLQQQIQQLQSQLNDQRLKEHKLCEDIGSLQLQRQQYEVRIGQTQEIEVLNAQLRQEVGDLTTHNQQLRLELQRLSEDNVNEQERSQALIVQLNTFQNELEQKNERLRQLDENRIEIERNLEKTLRQENDFKLEISRLNTTLQQNVEELRRSEHVRNQFQDEIYNLKKQKEDCDKLINQLREENIQSNGSIEETKVHKLEILNLHNELSLMKSHLEQNELKYSKELEISNLAVSKLQIELKEQREKNNDLRQKNWKVMEALNTVESRLIKSTSNKVDLNQIKLEIINQEHENYKKFIQKLFPDIKELENFQKIYDIECENLIKDYLNNLQIVQLSTKTNENDKEIKQLESQISQYKNVIDNTEKMLSNLQSHIEREEINWRKELAAKTAELDALKQNTKQLHSNVITLEKRLEDELENKNKIKNDYEEYKNRTKEIDAGLIVEKLTQEVNRLKEQLDIQQKKNGDICTKATNCNSINGPAVFQENNN